MREEETNCKPRTFQGPLDATTSRNGNHLVAQLEYVRQS